MRDAAIVGYGVVGKATAKAFTISRYWDLTGQTIEWDSVKTKKIVFLCLPTPTNTQGFCDTSIIEGVIEDLLPFYGIIVIRSTVPPGFARRMSKAHDVTIVSNPEFLSEDTVTDDVKYPKMVVIGSDDPKAGEEIKAMYSARYKYIKPLMTNTVTAELIKYTFNTWFATKVMFFNEIFDVATEVGANYEAIRAAIEAHPWGAKNHTAIWYKDRRGIHGRCLPKDLEAFVAISNSRFFQTIHEENKRKFT